MTDDEQIRFEPVLPQRSVPTDTPTEPLEAPDETRQSDADVGTM